MCSVSFGPRGDLLEVLGLNGSERPGDTLGVRPRPPKHQAFEFRGNGDVKRRRRRQGLSVEVGEGANPGGHQ